MIWGRVAVAVANAVFVNSVHNSGHAVEPRKPSRALRALYGFGLDFPPLHADPFSKSRSLACCRMILSVIPPAAVAHHVEETGI